jgi:hypothetical protein
MKRLWAIEILWLVGIMILSMIAVGALSGWRYDTIEIQLHDTYFIYTIPDLFILFLLNISFFVLLVRQWIRKFNNNAGNIMLLIITGALLFNTSSIVALTKTLHVSWTVYPPLSAIPGPVVEDDGATNGFYWLAKGYEVFQILVLIFTGIITGRNSRKIAL